MTAPRLLSFGTARAGARELAVPTVAVSRRAHSLKSARASGRQFPDGDASIPRFYRQPPDETFQAKRLGEPVLRKILVPLDRSALAEEAIGQAALIARGAHAEIDLLLVHAPFPFAGFSDEPWDTAEWTSEHTYLEAVAKDLTSGAGVSVTHAVMRGEPVEHICSRALDVGADLIVMTSHGRTGLSRAWLGSVADAVVRHSTTPVLLLHPTTSSHMRVAARHPFKRILVPLDDSALAAEAIAPAVDLARATGAGITLLRVVIPIPLIDSYDATMPFAHPPLVIDEVTTGNLVSTKKAQLDELARRLHDAESVDVQADAVTDSNVAGAIVQFAQGHSIDVIAMSTHGRGASRLVLGSVADKVLRGSGVPVLLRRPPT